MRNARWGQEMLRNVMYDSVAFIFTTVAFWIFPLNTGTPELGKCLILFGLMCRLSCCVAGNCNLTVKEEDLKETLELMSERLGHFTGMGCSTPHSLERCVACILRTKFCTPD